MDQYASDVPEVDGGLLNCLSHQVELTIYSNIKISQYILVLMITYKFHLQNWGFHFLPGSYGNCEQPQRHVCLDVPILHDGHKQLQWDQDLDHYRRHPQVHPV